MAHVTLYESVLAPVSTALFRGICKGKMATMREVAEHAGVSVKTVSRVFRDEPNVSAELRARVSASMKELGYVPNMLSQAFRHGYDPRVVVAVTEIHDPFFAMLIAAIEEVLVSNGLGAVVAALQVDGSREREALQPMIAMHPLGLIMTPASADQGFLKAWQEQGPVVFMDRMPNGIEGDCIVADDQGGGYEATMHLVRGGHRRIAFFGDSPDVSTTRNRFAGYAKALEDAGIGVDPGLVCNSYDVSSAGPFLDGWRDQINRPTAAFCSNERTSVSLLSRFRSPEWAGTAYVSFGDFPAAEYLDPGVTVVDHTPRVMGRLAAERLLDRMEQPSTQFATIQVPIRLTKRGSGEIRGPYAT